MKNNKLKEVEKRYRELGVEGDEVFTLIASEYIQLHKLDLSERLVSIIKKANGINCNGNRQKIESITKRVVRYDKLGKELPILYQFFHSKRFRDNTGKFFTPGNIAKSMVDMLPPKNDAVIFDPTCGGGTFLLEASEKWKNSTCHLVANDIDNYLVTLTEIILKIQIPKKHNLSLFNENIYSPEETILLFQNKVDYILANPPFSLTIDNFSPESKLLKRGYRKSDALFIDLAKDLLKEGGKLVCLLPHSIISNKEYAELRKVVEEDWHINAVMVLPEGVFQETANTTTRADILVLKKKGQGIINSEILFCNISSIGLPLNSRDSLFEEDDLSRVLKQVEVKKVLEIN
ncbi:MAG: N-6 DNA methylase [Desulfobacterales bacterium]|nr:N-6 DNA methylase [Desulfobacterales bacterium]